MRKRLIPGAVILLCALVLALCGAAHADEAENITGSCTVKLCSKNFKAAKITDGLYTSYWESDKTKTLLLLASVVTLPCLLIGHRDD